MMQHFFGVTPVTMKFSEKKLALTEVGIIICVRSFSSFAFSIIIWQLRSSSMALTPNLLFDNSFGVFLFHLFF